MAARTEPGIEQRIPLSRDRVLRTAVAIADEQGIEALTMRRLAEEVRAEAMSLYYHVANKDDVLDGIVDVVVQEINDAVDKIDVDPGTDWKSAVRARILSARAILLRHPWTPRVIETRVAMSPAVLHYFDGLLGIMRSGGFSYDLAHHALHALGSRALGFTQELFNPGDEPADEESMTVIKNMVGTLPHLIGMLAEIAHDDPDSTLGWCDDQAEFEFGLDLILDGLDRVRTRF